MKNLIIASTSTVHGGTYLSYLFNEIKPLFSSAKSIVFIPYARPGGISHDAYTKIASEAFNKNEIEVKGLHSFKDPIAAIENAEGVFVGGGNTFVLVSQLYSSKVMAPLRDAIFNGLPYLGTSAGSNICGPTMMNTNDMPISYPPSFKTIGAIPFNLNPHYLDPDPKSTHMGETRETRIKEYHAYNTVPVVGLREGSWLRVIDQDIQLQGVHSARIFRQDKSPEELETGSFINL